MVIRRLHEIPKSTVILYWHHIYQYLFRYLDFHKL